jgi:replication factor C small subunit|tara:strand:- start:2896 stop:3807 length:912 start_codon:yes stop_codon:yes gene_type:complete
MLWTEKYRPNKLGDIVGQEHFVMDALSWKEEKDMPNILAYGNSGNGKTSAMIALAKTMLGESFSDNFIEVNASDDRRLETVRNKIKSFAQSATFGDVPFRMCLLDEMDGMTNDAQNALKRIMERYASNIRFIITCNDRNKIIFALQSRCANYHFKPISNESMLTVIETILEKEKITRFSREDLTPFIYAMNGDIRRAITEIQAAKSSNSTLQKQVEVSLEDYTKILMKIVNKNSNVLYDVHNLLYEGQTVKEVCIGLHEAVINADGLDSNTKFKFLRTIGESEYRSQTMTPKLLLSWLVGQLL